MKEQAFQVSSRNEQTVCLCNCILFGVEEEESEKTLFKFFFLLKK